MMHNPPLKIMAPAVEGVQKTHGLFFILRRQGFYYRTEHDFQQPAAHGIDHDGKEQSDVRIRHHFRQDGQAQETKRGCSMRDEQRSDPAHGYIVCIVKGQKQKRREIIDDSLYHVSGVAGCKRACVGLFHLYIPLCQNISQTIYRKRTEICTDRKYKKTE